MKIRRYIKTHFKIWFIYISHQTSWIRSEKRQWCCYKTCIPSLSLIYLINDRSSLLPLGLGFILSTKSWDYMTLGHTQRHAPDNVCSCGQLKPRHFLIIRKGLSGEKLNVKLSREVLCKITCMSCGRSDGIPVVKHVLCCIKVWRNQNRRGKKKG